MQAELSGSLDPFRYDDDVRAWCSPARATPSAPASTAARPSPREHELDGPGGYPGFPTPWMYDDPGRDIGPKAGLWKPVIAAVQGMACGGAFYMLGETEFIIAADDATFFDPHVTYGMTAAFEPIQMLSKMPFPEVMRMSLLGAHERMSAERAREMAWSPRCAPGRLLERAAWVARMIADSPPLAVQGAMRALWTAFDVPRSQALGMANLFARIGSDAAAFQGRSGPLRLWPASRLAAALKRSQ